MAKKATLELSIAVETGRVKSNLDQVKAAFVTATSGINASLASIKGFVELKRQTQETAKAYAEAQRKVAELAREVNAGIGGKALANDFKRAQADAGRLKQTLEGERVELHRLRQSLTEAGVSTRDLGATQNRMQAELEQSKAKFQALAQVANARDALGLRRHEEIRAAIAKTRESYKTLVAGAQLTAREHAQAWVQMQDQVAGLKKQLNGWGKALVDVRGELVAAGVGFVAWTRGVVGAAQEAIRFEAAFADVKKVVDGSPEQMAGLSDEIMRLGREIPTAHAGLAQIAAMGGQMGLPTEDIAAFTTAAATMGTAFSMPADQVGQAIGTMKSIFNLTVPEVVALGDNINVLGNTMATNEAAIIEVLNRIGGSVKVFGLGKEQAAALSAAMLELGQSPEVASTSINTLLTKLQTANVQTPKFKEALESIGLSAEQMAAMVNDKPQQAIDTLLATLGKLNKQEQAEALTNLFGAEYQDNIALLVQGIDSYRKALATVDDQAKVLGSTEREAAERNKTSAAQLQLLRNGWAEVAINVGNVFLPALNAVVGVLRTVTAGIADFAKQYPGLTQALVLAAGAATTFFAVFAARKALMLAFGGEILGTIANLKNLVPALADGVKGFKLMEGGVVTLKGALGGLSALLLAWEFGQWVGGWLGSFSPIQKGMADLIYGADRVRLGAMKMWATLTGGDVDAVEKQIEIAKQAHADLLKDIESAGTFKPGAVPEQQPAAPVEDEQAKNAAIMKSNEDAVAKMREADAKALEEKKQKEIAAAEQAAEAKRKLDEEAAARVAAEPEPAPDPKPVEQTQQVRRVVERQTEIREKISTRQAETAREVEEQAAREKEEREVKADESRQQRLEAARRNAEEEAAAERELLEERAAASEQAAAEETERLKQLQADQAKAAEERMAREQAATEKAKSIFERYADRVKTLQDEIAGREQSLKDDLAEMDPNADEETKWRRRAAEAKNYEKAAKQAKAAGNLEEAQSLADKAREAYKGLGSGAAGIDERTAKQMAFAGIKSAGTLGLDLAKLMPEALKKSAQIDLSKVEGLTSQAAAMLGGRMDGMAGDAGGTAKPAQVHEIRWGEFSVQGGEADVNDLLRRLEMSRMTA